MNIKLNPLNLLLIVLVATSLVTLGACQERTALLVKDSSTSIAIERTGLDGEYDPSGLAKRVAKAFSEDPTLKLKDISTIYVAQNNHNIILKGTISDRALLDKLVKVAKNIEGVKKVDVSLVEIL